MTKMIYRACFVAFLSFSSLALPASNPSPTQRTVYGVLEAIHNGGEVLVIRHESIPGLMQAMTMPFELSHLSLAAGLHPGDSVRFIIEKKGNFWPIIAIKKIAPRHATKAGDHHEP